MGACCCCRSDRSRRPRGGGIASQGENGGSPGGGGLARAYDDNGDGVYDQVAPVMDENGDGYMDQKAPDPPRRGTLEEILGLAHSDRDVVAFLRRGGVPDAEEPLGDPA
ncbi:hypothetical protein AB0H77_04845 [Streptomyces sp. NPDC050844]|uniref:hypothetical protein n=1 Tax=Streptomyces sp. NPDC050844 TaxID=3155790 RepID=UPI0033F0490D